MKTLGYFTKPDPYNFKEKTSMDSKMLKLTQFLSIPEVNGLKVNRLLI
jgi:hypothetical protein